MSDNDSILLGILFAPWWLLFPCLVLAAGFGVWYISQSPEEKAQFCQNRVSKYGLPFEYNSKDGCIVQISPGRWQKAGDFNGEGIILKPLANSNPQGGITDEI